MPDGISEIYSDAVEAHQRGDLDAAERGYRAILSAKPSEAEVQYLLGALLLQRSDAENAVPLLQACLRAQPNHIAALGTLGAAFAALGLTDQAIQEFGRAANASPEDPKTLFNLAKACLDSERFDLGAETLQRFLKLKPSHAVATQAYASCLIGLDRITEAIYVLEDAIKIHRENPGLVESYIQQLLNVGRFDEALEHLNTARKRWPSNDTMLLAQATTFRLLNRHEDALATFESLVERAPNNENYLNSFGGYLYDTGKWKDAESLVVRSLKIKPDSHSALTNMGRIRQQRGDFSGANLCYQKALGLNPSYADAHNNLANLFSYMDEADQALVHFDRAIELKPNSNGIRYNRSLARMTAGEISSSVPEHRHRFDKENPSVGREWEWPSWANEPMAGKKVLLWGEQGMGDQVIFARCAPIIASKTEYCALECSPRLTALFKRSFPGVDIYSSSNPPPEELSEKSFDFHCSTLDMTCSLYENPADISSKPHLKADPELTRSIREKYKASAGNAPLIGISWWSGLTSQAHFKSTPLKQWQSILTDTPATFVSLQYGEGRDEVEPIKSMPGINLIDDRDIDPMGDLDVFAAQIAAMDMVITISNTTAHIAGALGVPTWTLTPTGPGRVWYWFTEGQTSPWYESMTLFRHEYNEGWDGVFKDVADRLRQKETALITPSTTD